MSSKMRLMAWISAFVVGLSLIGIDHRGVQTIDHLFQLLGWKAWSKGDGSGLHISLLVALVLVGLGTWGLHRELKARYKHPGRRIVLAAIGFLIVFPSTTYVLLLGAHWNSTGISALDYSKESKCNWHWADELVVYQCNLKLINHSASDQLVEVRPLVHVETEDLIEPHTILLSSHSKRQYGLTFVSKPNVTQMQGFSTEIGVQFRQGDEVKVVRWY
ncbi:hypothetical protein ACX1C1_19885 [Paenibacillus sp. strain BS8-2]